MISAEYLAGFLDGEGCIGIYGKPLRVVVTLVQAELDILLRIQTQYGGKIKTRKRSSPKHNQVWALVWNASSAVDLLEKLFPYLIVKRPQAQLVLQEWTKLLIPKKAQTGVPRGTKFISIENMAKRLEVKETISNLNSQVN